MLPKPRSTQCFFLLPEQSGELYEEVYKLLLGLALKERSGKSFLAILLLWFTGVHLLVLSCDSESANSRL